jgi:hypothetical protein
MVIRRSGPLRPYFDTSVYGRCFDAEFAGGSNRPCRLVRLGHVIVFSSDVIIRELNGAPAAVRELFTSLPPTTITVVHLTPDVIESRIAQLAAGIVDMRFSARGVDRCRRIGFQEASTPLPSSARYRTHDRGRR